MFIVCDCTKTTINNSMAKTLKCFSFLTKYLLVELMEHFHVFQRGKKD